MHFLRTLTACAGLWSMAVVHAATTAPTVDLGTLATFATYTDTDARSFNQLYDRQFNFTLASDATVRIDTRQIGNSHWLGSYYAAGLTDVSLSLLDANSQMIGTANLDATFDATSASCLSGGKCRVEFARGYTLTAALTAGTYTMELTGRALGSGPGSVLNLGALVVGAGDQAAYLSALTPATNLPEPGSWAMMGLGLLGVAAVARTKRLT